MTALWVIALILLVLILLMLLPVGLQVHYDDAGATVKAQIGWIRFSVFPKPPKQNQQKKRKKKKPPQPEPQAPEKKPPMRGIRDFQPFIRLAVDFLGALRQKVVVRSLTLRIWYGGKDAAEAAIHYGQAWAVIGAVMPLLDASVRIQARDVQAIYLEEANTLSLLFQAVLRLRLGQCLALAMKYGLRALAVAVEWKRRKEKTA